MRIVSWGRKALVLAALIGAPALAAAPAAQAQPVPAVMLGSGPAAELVPVQYYGPPRGYYGHRHRHWRRPPPPPRYYRHYGGYRGGYHRGPPRHWR
ncbi:hypothetical protein [Roseomonas indoligenes]|uniref:Uncharacterized protein n=1 Tax=Roseomonas indoligenes TaxID=2820811 RepID=A0A940MW01_9PROT|nr:hypothetical protein [Pararoseomonas indoligenes]MBP0495228.1 hypothetical protein [Pararoseomonas indoligenes]